MKKILGFGNALTDIVLQITSDDVLTELGLVKGSMQLVDQAKETEIRLYLKANARTMAAGGSAANTICGISKLGGSAGFIGKIGSDEIGAFFKNDLEQNKVTPVLLSGTSNSGSCTVLVSPDGERTMCTFLGAASEMNPDELNVEMFSGYDIFHIEGYLVFNQQLIHKAVQLAKEAGLLVSIDLASFNVVDANLDFLQKIVAKYVDVLFANEEEARSFTSLEPLIALEKISEQCDISVVKVGKDGSFVKSNGVVFTIKPYEAQCKDTTGAGDLYAAGFLYGLANDLPLDRCGDLGSLVSARVVEVLGAKMSDEVWNQIITQSALV